MSAGTNPTTQNPQGMGGYLASLAWQGVCLPVKAAVLTKNAAVTTCSATAATYRVARAGFNFLFTSGKIPDPLQQTLIESGAERTLKDRVGILSGTAKNAAVRAIKAAVGNRGILYRTSETEGIDINPLHLTRKALPSKPLLQPSPAPVAEAASEQACKESRIVKRYKHELRSHNVKRLRDQAKNYASEHLYPIITNYSRAYWLLTSVLGIPLDSAGQNNQMLMTFVDALKKTQGNNFNLELFKDAVKSRGFAISKWQSIKLSFYYNVLGSWITKLLIPALCNRAINLLYEQLFGDHGKKQAALLTTITRELANFIEKYEELLKEAKKRPAGVSEEAFISQKIRDIDVTSLYSHFADTLIKCFLPSIGKSLIAPQIRWVQRNFRASGNSSSLVKNFVFFGKIPVIISLKILQAIGGLIEKTIQKIAKSLLIDLGPTIVESTVESLQSPSTQMNLQETFRDLFVTLNQSLLAPTAAEAQNTPALPSALATDPKITANITRLAESLGRILNLKNPSMAVPASSPLEHIIRFLNIINRGERVIVDGPINGALTSLIPTAFMNMFAQYLNPKYFTDEVVMKQIDIIAGSFSPSTPFDAAAQAKKRTIERQLDDALTQTSDISIHLAVKTAVEDMVLPILRNSPVECPRVRAGDPAARGMMDLEQVVKDSFVPRLKNKYLTPGINLIFDENAEKFAMMHLMKIINSIFR